MPEQDPTNHVTPEQEPKSELSDLPAELGFIGTAELLKIKDRLVEAFANGAPEEQISHLLDLYHAAGRKEVEKIEPADKHRYTRAEIGLRVSLANIYYSAGQYGRYRSELKDAMWYANNMAHAEDMGYSDIAGRIQEAIDRASEDAQTGEQYAILDDAPTEQGDSVESNPETIDSSRVVNLLRELKSEGLEVDFEEADIDHIQPMDEEKALGYLFDSLINAGVEDPEAYLKEKGVLE